MQVLVLVLVMQLVQVQVMQVQVMQLVQVQQPMARRARQWVMALHHSQYWQSWLQVQRRTRLAHQTHP